MALSLIQPKKLYSMSKLHYEYVKEDRYLYLYDHQNQMIYYTTPILKVYKNLYESNNNYYLVLDLDNEDDVNNDIYNFKTKLDKLYGKSQDEVRKNYKEIFSNSKGIIDNITYETCVKRPYTGSRGQLIKLLIPEDDEELFRRMENVMDGENIRCEMVYKGLKKIQGGKMLEEYILINFITEQEWMSELTRKMLNPYRTNLNIHVQPTQESTIQEVNQTITCMKEETLPVVENQEEPSIQENIKTEEISNEETKKLDSDEFITNQEIKNSDDEYEDLMDVISLMDKENFSEEIKKEKNLKRPKESEKEKKKKKSKEEKENEKKEKKKDFLHKMKKINEPESMDSDADNLSDNEEFSKLSKKEKEKFRKIYRNMKRS